MVIYNLKLRFRDLKDLFLYLYVVIYNDQGYFLCESKDSPNDIFESDNTIVTFGKNYLFLLLIYSCFYLMLNLYIFEKKFRRMFYLDEMFHELILDN